MPHRTTTRNTPMLTTFQNMGGSLVVYNAELGQEALHSPLGEGILHRNASCGYSSCQPGISGLFSFADWLWLYGVLCMGGTSAQHV